MAPAPSPSARALASCTSGPPYAVPAGVPTVPLAFRARLDFSEWFELDRVCVFLDGAPLFGVEWDLDHRAATGQQVDWATRVVPGAHVVAIVVQIDQAQEPDGSPGAGHGTLSSSHTFEAAKERGASIVAIGAEKPGAGRREGRLAISWSAAPPRGP